MNYKMRYIFSDPSFQELVIPLSRKRLCGVTAKIVIIAVLVALLLLIVTAIVVIIVLVSRDDGTASPISDPEEVRGGTVTPPRPTERPSVTPTESVQPATEKSSDRGGGESESESESKSEGESEQPTDWRIVAPSEESDEVSVFMCVVSYGEDS